METMHISRAPISGLKGNRGLNFEYLVISGVFLGRPRTQPCSCGEKDLNDHSKMYLIIVNYLSRKTLQFYC